MQDLLTRKRLKLPLTTTNGKFFRNANGGRLSFRRVVRKLICMEFIKMKLAQDDTVSLQEAFDRFRSKRLQQIRSTKQMLSRPLEEQANSERLTALRKKFVNQALKYLGVPYAKRYHEPGSPDYDAPLYLDCCALVRKVLVDMKNDLGFRVGRWNQSYQFDTLPITIEREEDMKPGDLVFISGVYFNPKNKKQKHKMVHVEIWLGDGEKTVGARYHRGRVQIHDSYRFVSKSYHSMVYHFKSIDTWLNGICRSFCPEHSWTQSKYLNHGKKSIFNTTSDSDNESAGDDNDSEDDDADFTVDRSGVIPRNLIVEEKISETGGGAIEKNQECSDQHCKPGFCEEEFIGASESNRDDTDCRRIPRNPIADEEISEAGSDKVEKSPYCCDKQCKPGCYEEDFIGASESSKGNTDCCRITRNLIAEEGISEKESSSRERIQDGCYRQCEPCCYNEEFIAALQVDKHGAGHNEICLEDIEVSCDCHRNDNEYSVSQVTQDSVLCIQHPDKDCFKEQRDDVSDFFGYDLPRCKCVHECLCACHHCSSTCKEGSKDVVNDSSNWQDHRPSPEVFEKLAITCAPGDAKQKEDLRSKQRGADRGANGGKPGQNNHSRRTRSKSPSKSPSKLPSVALSFSQTSRMRGAPKFYIGGKNGVALVEKPLLAMGWRRIDDGKDLSYYLKWVECKSSIDYKNFREGQQMVNHIPYGSCLTTKTGLMKSLQDYEKFFNKTVTDKSSTIHLRDFYPETFKLDGQKDIDSFSTIFKDGETWICKPAGMNQGKGIFLVKNLEQLRTELDERYNSAFSTHRSTRIISRYIENPLLLDKCKFDIRAYMLIASTTPYLVFYHSGYARKACETYSCDSTDLTSHLTNQLVQKKHPGYSDKKDDSVWTFEMLNDYVEKHYKEEKGLPDNWVFNGLTDRIKEIMLICFQSVQCKLERKRGYFDLLGFDFMVDDNMKIWLLEVNVNPALFTNCEQLRRIMPNIVDETLAICIEAFENKCRKKKANPLESVKTFELLFDGERNISFKKKHSKEEATANYSKKDEVREDDSQGAKNVESNVQNDDTGQTLGPELTTKPIAAVGDSVS